MSFYFQNLIVWQKAFLLTKMVQKATKRFPKQEQFVLGDQMRRAALSIVSNIAEGSGRGSNLEHKHFLHIAKGSSMELATQILLAQEYNSIETKEKDIMFMLVEEGVKMLYVMTKTDA